MYSTTLNDADIYYQFPWNIYLDIMCAYKQAHHSCKTGFQINGNIVRPRH